MNKKIIIFIVGSVFELIISCKNYADLKQSVEQAEQKVKGFREGVEKKVKQGIKQAEQKVKGFLGKEVKDISDEIAKKLKEEEKDKKEEKKEQAKEVKKQKEKKEELMQADDPNNINHAQILQQANGQDSKPALEAVQQSANGGQQKAEEEAKEKEVRAKAEQEAKEKEERKRKQQEEEREKREKEVKAKIEELTNKIDEINNGIDSIKHRRWFVEDEKRFKVKATEVRDKVTGPVFDYFTNDSKGDTGEGAQTEESIYYGWGLTDLEEDEEELVKLLKELQDTRSSLRTKLNVGNQQKVVLQPDPELKESVKVSEIESDLEELKSKLEKVKNYLRDEAHFDTIKGYINDANSNRISEYDE